MVVMVMLTLGHPRTIQWLWAPPGSGPDWTAGRTHWLIVASIAGALFVGFSLDPAVGTIRGRTRHATVSAPGDSPADRGGRAGVASGPG
jgi:hypothetical protein